MQCLEKESEGGLNGSARWMMWQKKAGEGRTPIYFATQTDEKRKKHVRLVRVGDALRHNLTESIPKYDTSIVDG